MLTQSSAGQNAGLPSTDLELVNYGAGYGWFRTVPNDLPHFTYLGHSEARLPELGLLRTERQYLDCRYDFWVPDLERLP